jgi:nucleoside-diphosphate-sugar epimerase
MTDQLMHAHDTGQVQVAIGRASDYFGPGTTRSALGETVFGPALTGRIAQVMGDPDQPHSYSYTPDVAAALITLATQPGATGSVWHLPISETRTTRHIIDQAYELAGHRPKSFAAGVTTLRLFGLIKPPMREYLHTLYQFTDPWVVDDTKYRTAFGNPTTPLDDALAATLQWYRDAAPTTTDRTPTPTRDTPLPRPHHNQPSPIEPEGTSP